MYTMPAINEHRPEQPYKSVWPGYIRGTTLDGKNLVARNILQMTDGSFHIQMEVVRYPSETRLRQTPPTSFVPFDSRLATGLGLGRSTISADEPLDHRRRNDSVISGSEKSINEECAIVTDYGDEDAEGEEESEEDALMKSLAEQRKMMFDMIRQGKCGIVRDGEYEG
jgi:hypothetical protein